VRSVPPQCWFDRAKCQRGIEALRQYRKEWDDKNKVFRNHPLHDWTSNAADAFRMFAWNRKRIKLAGRGTNGHGREDRVRDDYDYLAGRER
jgi:hypothetical protein